MVPGRRTLLEILCIAGDGLVCSEEWTRIIDELTATDGWRELAQHAGELGREELSRKLDEVLEQVVQLAGGWQVQNGYRPQATTLG